MLAKPPALSGLTLVCELSQEDLSLPEASIAAVVEGSGDEECPGAGCWILVEVLSNSKPYCWVRQSSEMIVPC
jgi:hypothetical protein